MSQWYYNDNGKVVGPCSDKDLVLMHKNRRIFDDTYVWAEGMPNWVTYKEAEPMLSPLQVEKPVSAVIESPEALQEESAEKPLEDQKRKRAFNFSGKEVSVPGDEALAKIRVLSGIDEMPGEGTCPSCGYYIGSGLTCIRCGARSKKYIPLRVIKFITLAGSVFGLVFLLFAARAKQPEEIKIAEIDVMMNGALVKVTGTISMYEEKTELNSFKFKVDDGTGEILVNAYGKLSSFIEFFGEKELPKIGDQIEVVGAINETEKFGVSLSLNLPERLKILKRFKAELIGFGNINSSDIGVVKLIRGNIEKMKSKTLRSGSKLYTFTLSDGTGSIELTMFDADMLLLKPEVQEYFKKKAGAVEMLVKIGEYQNKLQAKIVDYRSVKIIKAETAPVDVNENAAEVTGTSEAEAEPAETESEEKTE